MMIIIMIIMVMMLTTMIMMITINDYKYDIYIKFDFRVHQSHHDD